MVFLFKCLDCGEVFEIVGGIGSAFIQGMTCPTCKSENIHKKWTVPVIHFKGDGFTKKIKDE
jgi:predicted nucleic acid-binding Zn ribbon protein